ncbi:cell wall hydrolase [Sphingobium aquiterrae]|uniref:cell wall hydrolase n=1 Tax=Sphingobium aquiterrae TaxID=2038656 RepID=UPI0030192000
MSFRLKVATVTAFTLSVLAAALATDASFASGTSAGAIEIIPTAVVAPQSQARPVGNAQAVRFAARSEIVQPLEAPATTNANLVINSQSMPQALPGANSLADLVENQGAPEDVDGDMRCLAGAVYFESKGESLEGQLAVARVIINRAQSGRFASSLCGVVYQPGQFSFVRNHDIPPVPQASRDWREAVAIAQIAMQDSWETPAEGALYFHARRVSPNWGKTRLAAIDNHVFYR